MASPFSVFRRHQRIMLAACAILAMIAFVILGPMMSGGSSGGPSGTNPVVVHWNHGELRESQIQYLMALANATNEFLGYAYQTAQASGAQPEMPMLPRVSEADVVRNALFAKQAEAQGMVMSDDMINAYLRRISGNAVNADQFEEILKTVRQSNRSVTMQNIFEELRRRLLAQQIIRLYESWSYGVPPGERWNYFLKLNQQALVDVVPVSTESFLSQVGEPTEAQVTALYERYKNVVRRPVLVNGTPLASPAPGFRQPLRAQFQYFKANFNEFVEVAKAQITDAEVEKYYKENKTLFPVGSSFLDDPEAAPGGETSADDKTAPAADPFAPGVDGQAPAEKSETPPVDAAPPAEGAAAATDATHTTEAAPPAGNEPAAEPNATESEPAPQAETPASETPAAPDQSSLRPARSQPRWLSSLTSIALVALQAEPPQAEAPAAAATTPAEAPPAATAPASGITPAPSASSAPPAVPAAPPLIADPSAPADPAPVAAEPLDKVRDTIRTRLAQERAAQEINRLFNLVEERLNTYASRYLLWQSTREEAPQSKEEAGKNPPPEPPDFDALGKEFGLVAVTLPPMSIIDLDRDTDLGKSYELRLVQGFPMPGQRLLNLAFGPAFPPFRPVRTVDDNQDQFLSWKTANMSEFTPPLDQIRAEVVRAWKLIEAREPARKKAEAWADMARLEKDKTLRQTLSAQPGVEVIEPDPFTWMTQGSAAFDSSNLQAARLTPIAQLNNVGPEFMRKVFSLQEGEIGVAWNFPQSVMYVIQLKKFEESEAVLHARFMSYNFERYGAAGMELGERIQSNWIGRMQNEQGMRWERQPRPAPTR